MRYVVAVAREHSFSQAAETLHVAQQAVSQQVRQVEKSLGVDLFERTNRGVTITPAGEVFVQEARRTLNAADRVVARALAAARGEAGTMPIAYTLATVRDAAGAA
jgi:DNA-binding transcriptional LysR family regulator